jgi:hypothetical protein
LNGLIVATLRKVIVAATGTAAVVTTTSPAKNHMHMINVLD